VTLGDARSILATGVGRIRVRMHADDKWRTAILQEVLFVPDLHGNLLSVSYLTQRGASLLFSDDTCLLRDKSGITTCHGHMSSNLYIMDIKTVIPEKTHIASIAVFPREGENIPAPDQTVFLSEDAGSKATLATWHRRLGHVSAETIVRMAEKGIVGGINIEGPTSTSPICEPCLVGKQTRTDVSKATNTRATEVLGRVFSDICGKLPTRSRQGFEYFATFTDDRTRKVSVAGLKLKSDLLHHLEIFVARAERETGKQLKILRSDGGGEYTGNVSTRYFEEKGIRQEITTAYTSEHNGVAERMNRTLLDKVRAMLSDADLPDSFWYDALEYAAVLHNHLPTRSLPDITPEEAWTGNKPNASRLRVFGCKAHMHVPKKHRPKLASHSQQCTFLGLSANYKAFKLIDRTTNTIYNSRDVVFDEGGAEHERVVIEDDDDDDLTTDDREGAPTAPAPARATLPLESPARPKRTIRAPIRDDDARYDVSSYDRKRPVRVTVADAELGSDPRTFDEAMARPDAAKWILACENERHAFEQMGVFEIVPRPRNRKIVGSRWVFRVKRGPDGSIQKYKARIVAQGFTQTEGVDYDETFAPVAKFASLRVILAMAAEMNLEVHQMDVKSAYLNGELKEEIFMHPPPGFGAPSGTVLRLLKAVYGTKQGGRVWYENIRSRLFSMGYTNTQADHAVFTRFADPHLSIIALYVDDITMASTDPREIERDKVLLKQHYEMTDLGDLTWILGMHVTRDRNAGWISLSQEKYSCEVLERFGKSSVRPIATPALANEHLRKLPEPESDPKPYQSAVGALMYPMLGTRPDLAYAVGALGRHNATPGPAHFVSLDRVFKYLRGSSALRLVFRRGAPEGAVLRGFVDADWASDINDRKSTSGFVFLLAGAAISWGSKKQTSVALSSTEAEYIAAAYAAKEAVWLRRLLSELGFEISSPTVLRVDNQSAIAIAHNPEFHDRTKHIDLRHHFLRERVAAGDIELSYVPTGDQLADIFTKGLVREKHQRFTREMGLHFEV
jgi:hypothetical protein